MQEFNKETFETMYDQVSKIKSIYEVCEYCKEGNRIANKEYLKKYPTHKDLLSIFECAVSILEFNILNDYKNVSMYLSITLYCIRLHFSSYLKCFFEQNLIPYGISTITLRY